MRIDVSEIKTYKDCQRKHLFSSRNRYHLVPNKPNDNLIFGTQFHEVLHMIYLGSPLEKILAWIDKEVTDSVHWKVMDNMAKGYYNGPYQQDKERYEVIDIEKKFQYQPFESNKDILLCGSIDMVCIDKTTNKFVGFEHKTAKNFRPEVYDLLDEQPRVYTWALKRILEDYHKEGKYLDVKEVDCVILNQVKKLQTKFDYQRVECRYTDGEIEAFMHYLSNTISDIAFSASASDPQPSFMKCQMCDYADLCMHYGYEMPKEDDILNEFEGEYEVRDHDHLDEKAERHNDISD